MACKPALYYLITLPITLEWLPPSHPEDPFCYVQPGVHSHLHLAVSSFHRVSKVLLSPFNASLSFEAFTACSLAHDVKHISWVFMSLLRGRNNLVHTYWTWWAYIFGQCHISCAVSGTKCCTVLLEKIFDIWQHGFEIQSRTMNDQWRRTLLL